MGCFAYCAQCAFDRLRAMRFGDFGIECAYGAIYAKSIVGPGAGCAGKILAMLCPACRWSLPSQRIHLLCQLNWGGAGKLVLGQVRGPAKLLSISLSSITLHGASTFNPYLPPASTTQPFLSVQLAPLQSVGLSGDVFGCSHQCGFQTPTEVTPLPRCI